MTEGIPDIAPADTPFIQSPPLVIQREEDGQYQIGWCDDAPGPFESRAFAEAVAVHELARMGARQ
jgi:hypothetical protein